MMEPFKLNISVLGSDASSTVPIYFDKFLMYTHPNYRGTLSLRLKLLKKEFRRAIGTDNFISQCSSMPHLFNFMEYYHNQVMSTVSLVHGFLTVINSNMAVLEHNEL